MFYRRGIRDVNLKSSLFCLDQKILRNFISRKGLVLVWPFRVENFPEMKLRDIAWQPTVWTVVESQFGGWVLEVSSILWSHLIFCEFQLYRAEIIQGSPQTCGSSISQRKKLKYQTILSGSLWFREIWEQQSWPNKGFGFVYGSGAYGLPTGSLSDGWRGPRNQLLKEGQDPEHLISKLTDSEWLS